MVSQWLNWWARVQPSRATPLDEQRDEALCIDLHRDVAVRHPTGLTPQVHMGAPAREFAAGVDHHAAVHRSTGSGNAASAPLLRCLIVRMVQRRLEHDLTQSAKRPMFASSA